MLQCQVIHFSLPESLEEYVQVNLYFPITSEIVLCQSLIKGMSNIFSGDWTGWTRWEFVLLSSSLWWYYIFQASQSDAQVFIYIYIYISLYLISWIRKMSDLTTIFFLSDGVDEYAVNRFLCQVFSNGMGSPGKVHSIVKEAASRKFDMKEEVLVMYFSCINSAVLTC